MAPRPRPLRNDEARAFWEGVEVGKLLIQQCSGCGELRHPPALRCRSCGSVDFEVVESSGNGTVFSYGIARYPPSEQSPDGTVFVVAELDEGVRIVSNLVGAPPDEVEIGMPIEVCYARLNSDEVLPLFRPRRQ